MADAFSDTTALADQVVSAYDRSSLFALRKTAVFDQYAKVRPGNQTSPGSDVSFIIWDNLTVSTTALAETTDPDAIALGDTKVKVTPHEQGGAVNLPIKVRASSFLLGFDADAANVVNYHMVDTVETLAEAALTAGGTEALHSARTAKNTIVAADTMTMKEVQRQVALLRADSVMPCMDEVFAAVMHPHVAFDLMSETGDGSWRGFHQRQDGVTWMRGEAGRAAGVAIVESPRAKITANGGSGNVDLYTTYIVGAEAFGKAESIPVHFVPGPIVDKLRRFMPLGWYGYFGYGVIRPKALRRLLTASSLGANA